MTISIAYVFSTRICHLHRMTYSGNRTSSLSLHLQLRKRGSSVTISTHDGASSAKANYERWDKKRKRPTMTLKSPRWRWWMMMTR
jgi:hypothetical protein